MVCSCDARPPVIVYPNALHRIHPHRKRFVQLLGVWTPTHDASVWRKINFGGYRFRRAMAPMQSLRQTAGRIGNWAMSKCSSQGIPPFAPDKGVLIVPRYAQIGKQERLFWGNSSGWETNRKEYQYEPSGYDVSLRRDE